MSDYTSQTNHHPYLWQQNYLSPSYFSVPHSYRPTPPNSTPPQYYHPPEHSLLNSSSLPSDTPILDFLQLSREDSFVSDHSPSSPSSNHPLLFILLSLLPYTMFQSLLPDPSPNPLP